MATNRQTNKHHAIVVGGSIAGLDTARVLSDFFDRVTIVERDALPTAPAGRKGTPQGEQGHLFMPLGLDLHEELFPGFVAEMQELGCPFFDEVNDLLYWTAAGWRARGESDVRLLGTTRTLLEHVVRDRVRALPNVEFRVGAASGLATMSDRTRVTGVIVNREVVEADLAVDASGRGSQAPKWMEDIGYERPDEMHLRAYVGYASRLVKAPAAAFPADSKGVIAVPYPGTNRGAAIFPTQNGLHMVIAAGMIKDYPPTDEQGFLDFLSDVSSPIIHAIVQQSEPVGEIKPYRMPGSQRRLWELLERRPRGFIVIGDAVASYNPIYAQGMTIAAHGAVTLRELLAGADGELDTLPELFQTRLSEAVEWAFTTAAATDAHFEGAEREGIPEFSDDDDEYFLHLEELATVDPEISILFEHSFGYMKPELLFSEKVKEKVAAWVASGRKLLHTDPMAPPALSSVSESA
ncbi:FAD-dependent oxidoreductase [Nocardia sp. CA-107356]|uniref:FAD-dependent oxidoreductase n=1 Tax=Nocardia sp. CA-107356 TaxID=3239972 RepID=UPI003D8A749F